MQDKANQNGQGLKEGQKAPAFSLKDQHDQLICLKDLKGQTVVLYFYPKDMTPGCTVQACDFRDNLLKLKKHKVMVLGVSKDSQDLHQRFTDKYDLNFSLLVDDKSEVCEKYGVLVTKTLFGKTIFGAIQRTTFIIDSDGHIQKIYPKVKAKGHVEQILKDLNLTK